MLICSQNSLCWLLLDWFVEWNTLSRLILLFSSSVFNGLSICLFISGMWIPNWSYYRQNEHFLHFTQDELVGFSIKLTNLFPIGYSLLPCAGTTKGSPSIMSMDFALILLVFFAEGQMVLPLMLPPLWRWSIYIPFS